MLWFVAIAAKSLVVAGGTLLLLRAASSRSAADRSWIAHLGLAALLLLPIASFALPALDVPGPSFLVGDSNAPVVVAEPVAPAAEVAAAPATFRAGPAAVTPAPIDWERWSYWAYVVPAALFLLLTLIAVGRLVALKARAQVLVDGHWLSALARAQRRMGFKNGTALLTSDDLRSPVSWGLMRPVIVLNRDAADAHDEAEAIIAHELAHVARLDWAKLLLARIAVAIFWFNPLVWLLAREAHQLREEAADDAVLDSDIDDTDYARLLVGIARHECNGMLLGAHGVAPSRNSLSRRVRRVLDRALTRAPGGWRWTSAAAFFAAGMAVPVAALNFVPTEPVTRAFAGPASVGGKMPAAPATTVKADGSGTIAAASALAAHPHPATDSDDDGYDFDIDPDDFEPDIDVDGDSELGREINANVREAMAEARAVARSANSEARAALAEARSELRSRKDRAIDTAVSARIAGVTPDYARAMRASAPSLSGASTDDLIAMRMHGVTPDFARQLQQSGHRDFTAEQLTSAAVHGVNAAFVRDMAAVGYPNLSLKDMTELRVMGVSPAYIREFQRAGYRNLTTKQLIKMRMAGVKPDEIRRADSP